MEKSPEAFRTISEVADDLDLPQHVLRFWETRFTTIRPLKRGGGRRYYRPDDVDLLKGIRHLLYGQGYTIKGVQRILKQDGLRFVQALGRGEQIGAPSTAPMPDDAEDANVVAFTTVGEPATSRLPLDTDETEAATYAANAGLSPQARDALRSALDELLECRRLLGNLKRE